MKYMLLIYVDPQAAPEGGTPEANAENQAYDPNLTPEAIADILGPQKFYSEAAERTEIPGVATGLAWMPTGGDILFIEASAMSGKGSLILTGQLGDVMKESARAGLSWVRTHVEDLAISVDFEKQHVPLLPGKKKP